MTTLCSGILLDRQLDLRATYSGSVRQSPVSGTTMSKPSVSLIGIRIWQMAAGRRLSINYAENSARRCWEFTMISRDMRPVIRSAVVTVPSLKAKTLFQNSCIFKHYGAAADRVRPAVNQALKVRTGHPPSTSNRYPWLQHLYRIAAKSRVPVQRLEPGQPEGHPCLRNKDPCDVCAGVHALRQAQAQIAKMIKLSSSTTTATDQEDHVVLKTPPQRFKRRCRIEAKKVGAEGSSESSRCANMTLEDLVIATNPVRRFYLPLDSYDP